MLPADQPAPQRPLKGMLGLIIAIAAVAVLLIFVPGYRLFFLISAAVGIAVAFGLRWWYARKPVEPENTKRPLGLD